MWHSVQGTQQALPLHLQCTDLAGTAQNIYLSSKEKKQICKVREGFRTLYWMMQNAAKYLVLYIGVMGIAGEHRPGWQSSAAGLESRFLGSRSLSSAKPLPEAAAAPQLAHHNQTAQAASEGCVCLLQKGKESQAIAINTGMLNKELYFSGIRAQEGEQQMRTGSVPTQPLQCLSTNVTNLSQHWQDLTSLLPNFKCGELTLLCVLPGKRQMN